MSPNPTLMHLYGTDAYYLTKTGAIPRAMGALAPLMFMGALEADHVHMQRLQQEAMIMNEMFRRAEHQRMQQAIMGFKGASAISEDFVKAAQDAGKKLAHEAVEELNKEALVGQVAAGLGKALMGAGKSIGWGGTGGFGRGGLMQGLGSKMLSAGSALGKAATPAATATTTAAKTLAKSKPLISTGTKLKVLGAGALAAGGYTAMKGAQTVRDYMMQPTSASQHWGPYGAAPMQNVNQYGYAQY